MFKIVVVLVSVGMLLVDLCHDTEPEALERDLVDALDVRCRVFGGEALTPAGDRRDNLRSLRRPDHRRSLKILLKDLAAAGFFSKKST